MSEVREVTEESVLSGIRVVDFTSGPAGGLATTVLADFGANVIKVEPPQGDRFRSMPSSAFWLRGKRSIVLDLKQPAEHAKAHDLVASADVVVVSGSPAKLVELGLDALTLRSEHAGLVHAMVTGWGADGPYSALPGYEGLVAAKAGRMAAFDVQLKQDRPVYAAVPVATHIASQATVQGIVAALIQRERTHQGAAVEASLLQALMPFDLVDLLARQISERDDRSFTPLRKLSPMPTLNYHPLRTSDGVWIQCGNLLEHLFYAFLDATELLGEFLTDERFQDSPAVWTPETIEEARDRILLRIQERTADEWMEAFAANGNVAAEPILTTAQALHHVDLVEGGGLVMVADPLHGDTTQVGPIAELSESPASVDLGAPLLGQHSDEILDHPTPSRADISPASSNSSDEANIAGRPLDGVTILDLSTIIAAPLGMTMLADLGARVIKVEPLGGDPFRGLLIEGRMAVKTNGGKESICINLKQAAGQALLHQLVEHADVLVHNFRGDVPAKLGIDEATLHAINPSLVWAVVNGYGPHGPGALRPATHPVIGAATGGVAYQAGKALTRPCPGLAEVRENARQIMAANEANPDPNTSAVAASSILLAVLHQRRTGQGQAVHINMQTANAWANHDDFLSYSGKPSRLEVDDDHLGLHASYRLYETREGWIFLAVTTDAEFVRFCNHAGCTELATDSRFATSESRIDNDDELATALSSVLQLRTADEWEAALAVAGVGCVRADGIAVDQFIASDPHMVANGWAPFVEHTRFGRVRRWGPVATVDGLNPDYRAAPLAGEHTDAVLHELGLTPDEIVKLREDKIVTSESATVSS